MNIQLKTQKPKAVSASLKKERNQRRRENLRRRENQRNPRRVENPESDKHLKISLQPHKVFIYTKYVITI